MNDAIKGLDKPYIPDNRYRLLILRDLHNNLAT